MVNSELKELNKQIAKARAEIRKRELIAKTKAEKRRLQSELSLLKSPTKRTAIKLAKRFGRGFKFISIKTGSAIKKQAQLIAEQQERERKATKQVKKVKKKLRARITAPQTREIFVPGVGVVTQKIKTKPVKVKKRKKKRQVTKAEPRFFSNLSAFG